MLRNTIIEKYNYRLTKRMYFPNSASHIYNILLILLGLIVYSHAISQICQNAVDTIPSNNTQCPQNSKCNSAGFCACERGFFANCLVNGQYLAGTSRQFTITENITYFIIEPSGEDFISFQFILCNQNSLLNYQILNLWVDDGRIQTPTQQNALGSDKSIKVEQGCLALMTSFLSFSLQQNKQQQILILGVKLQYPGTTKIQLQVQEIQLIGFQIILRIILILLGAIALVSLGAIVYCIYKCRRRRTVSLNQQRNDISFFDQFMPSKKANLQQIKEEICSVCLGDFKENQEIRPTVCGHYFHKQCLDEWCVTHLSCPICRTSFQKADLIHNQYLSSRKNSISTNQHQLAQNGVINGEGSLRQPII